MILKWRDIFYVLFKPALPSRVRSRQADFCPEDAARNITWKKTYHGHNDKNLCPNGTIGKVLEYETKQTQTRLR